MKKIAAILTEYRALSHADVIVTKFLKGFPTDEGMQQPRVEVASIYIDQFPEKAGASMWESADIGRGLAADHGVPIYPSIVKALTLGTDKLAVDGVLLIGEHGDYAWNEKEQHLFPRKYFMEQICGVMSTSGRAAPIFNDKHLSYNWHDIKWMYDRAKQVGAPFMAGSTVPLGWRNPWLEHEPESPISEAIAIGFSGLDIYGFHTLEGLQCMVERRKGGETGVKAVTCLEGEAVWQAAREGRWSRDLAEAACASIETKPAGSMEEHCKHPAIFLIEYRDGTKGAILMLNGYVTDLAYAARVGGKVQATELYLQGHGGSVGSYSHFSYLSLNLEEMFLTGQPTYPVERTVLTSGVLEAALSSRHEGHRRLETSWLDISYPSYDSFRWRPRGPRPTGACLEPWPPAHS
ncbi:MAG: hypothetical protein FJY95_11395 [Candidatus Handelsmanbacteria bacterium]|nr:hypothetical protein [Candidatus Handelsmanbacteria bacterium]